MNPIYSRLREEIPSRIRCLNICANLDPRVIAMSCAQMLALSGNAFTSDDTAPIS